ncbi:NAD(P)H-dependent oxidoreductase [Desulfopila aestuarii]|uniref:Putative NADPH-quinone reductase (Modulator of drug activity B) n=1 Tax=Desulfopila aestuarii DSM 18488 TaxID=1121416 RepID=A0A1M7Y4Q6_9BACT|nr:NAD(P)H-dependent oxidoreductase [Desulfopila aestuarii]SHO47305.1 Putative NADPH-quinone reductase (modulator of drug activity B) [Desulfopila aestuarii DSM 18488]
MKVSVILAHPDPASFNHAIAQATITALKKGGLEVMYHDLYQERFDAILPSGEIPKDVVLPPEIAAHCQEASEADGFVIIHPNWWGMPPAILTGWVDRVMRPGIAYEFLEGDTGEGVPNGLLKAKSVIVFNTSNTETERERTVFLDPLETIWKNCIFDLCGVRHFHRRMFNVIVTSTREQRENWLKEVEETVASIFNETCMQHNR